MKFPKIKDNSSSQITHKENIIQVKVADWKEKIVEIILQKREQVPVLMAYNSKDQTTLKAMFKKHNGIDLSQL